VTHEPGLPRTYAEHGYWRRYLPSLPDGGAALVAAPLVEERWAWRRHAVHLHRLEPAGVARGTVIVVHGGGGNGRLVMASGPELAADGWRVVAPDLPGYGLTTPADPRATDARTMVAEWTALVHDMAVRFRAETGAPVFLVGHSVGSWVAYNAAAAGAPVDGIAVTMLGDPASPDVVRAAAGSWWKARLLLPLGDLAAPVIAPIPVRIGHMVALGHISHDPRLVRVIREDPLIGRRWVRLGLLRSFVRMRFAVPPERFTAAPVLVVHPGADPWLPAALTHATYARLAAPKRMVELEGAGHFPIEPAAWATLHAELRAFLAAPRAVTTPRPAA
jgi:alpha-beta hydrolase superfamily lysophospholipase